MSAEVCAVHGKRRLLQDLYSEAGQYRCLPNKICRMEGASTGMGMGMGGGNRADADICTVHGKKRLLVDMTNHDGGVWKCLPNKICRDDNGKCRKHGRLRLISDLDVVGPNEYECKPTRICYTTGTGMPVAGAVNGSAVSSGVLIPKGFVPGTGTSVEEQLAAGASQAAAAVAAAAAAGQTSLSAGMYSQHSAVRMGYGGVRPSGATDARCHLHGRRIPIAKVERVDGVYNVCRDRYTCLGTALDPIDHLQASGCSEVFCAVHGTLRSPQFLVPMGDKAFKCAEHHQCTGPTSQRILDKFRRYE